MWRVVSGKWRVRLGSPVDVFQQWENHFVLSYPSGRIESERGNTDKPKRCYVLVGRVLEFGERVDDGDGPVGGVPRLVSWTRSKGAFHGYCVSTCNSEYQCPYKGVCFTVITYIKGFVI